MIPNAIPFYLFRRMKNVLLADFPAEVRKMHAAKPWFRNISPELAREIAALLLKQSKEAQAKLKVAKRDGEPKKRLDELEARIWVVIENGHVRGYRTNAKGSVAERYPDSYRNRFDRISPHRRAEFVAEIMRLEDAFRSAKLGRPLKDAEKCKPEEVEKIINRGLRKGGFFKHNKATDLYCGVNAPEPDPSRIISNRSPDRLTAKQREHWELFGMVPGLAHDFENTLTSELVPWVIAEAAKRGETIDSKEAIRRYNAARKCSRIASDVPFEHLRGKIYGRNFYSAGDFRNMPYCGNLDAFRKWADKEAVEGADTEKLLEQAIAAGEVIQIDRGIDPIEGVRVFAYIGADTMAAELKAEEERERAEQERKEAEERKRIETEIATEERKRQAQEVRIKPWIDALQDPDSSLSKQLRRMPKFEGDNSTRDGIDYLYGLALWQNGILKVFSDRNDAITVFHRAKDAGLIVFDLEEYSYVGADLAPIAA
jgi:hypothetical protein